MSLGVKSKMRPDDYRTDMDDDHNLVVDTDAH